MGVAGEIGIARPHLRYVRHCTSAQPPPIVPCRVTEQEESSAFHRGVRRAARGGGAPNGVLGPRVRRGSSGGKVKSVDTRTRKKRRETDGDGGCGVL